MKTFIFIIAMSFIAACSINKESPIEATEEIQAPVIKTASACADKNTCK